MFLEWALLTNKPQNSMITVGDAHPTFTDPAVDDRLDHTGNG